MAWDRDDWAFMFVLAVVRDKAPILRHWMVCEAKQMNIHLHLLWWIFSGTKIKYHLHFTSFLPFKMFQVIEIYSKGGQEYFSIALCKYHGCWWPGCEKSQGISSYGIDLVSLNIQVSAPGRVNTYILNGFEDVVMLKLFLLFPSRVISKILHNFYTEYL